MANLSASLYVRSQAGYRKPSKKLTDLSAGENYQLTWYEGKSKKSRNIGRFADAAQIAVINKEAELRKATVKGTLPATVVSEVEPAKEKKRDSRRPISGAIAAYLERKKLAQKKPKTLAAYTTALAYFRESCTKVYLEEIDQMDMLRFHALLKEVKKQSPRSCWNKFSNVMGFLKTQNIRGIVQKEDWPEYVEEPPEVYEPEELEAFFDSCTDEERVWFEFFLMTGMREQEVVYCDWKNLNAKKGTVSVTWKPEYNWTPKAYRGREIPIPATLLNSLTSIQAVSGLMFRTASGRPKLDFLDCCKAIAKRAGLDPTNFWLHKFRATFATWHLQAGVDLRTLQSWLGHKDLESTMRYLRPAQGAAVQAKVNNTFSGFNGAKKNKAA